MLRLTCNMPPPLLKLSTQRTQSYKTSILDDHLRISPVSSAICAEIRL